jgi:hypothetical protein
MAFTPISNAVIQYSKNASGASASDYYLKLYAASTSTPISMYSLADGSGALAKCQINSLGFPVNGSDAVFIPYIDQKYRMVLYTSSTDADANTFANAVFDIDDVPQQSINQSEYIKNFPTLALAVASTTIENGDVLNIKGRTCSDGSGTFWDVVLSSTVTENAYNIVQGTGVGTLSLVLRQQGSAFDYMTQAEIDSVVARDGSADVTTAIQTFIDAVANNTGTFPDGRYYVTTLTFNNQGGVFYFENTVFNGTATTSTDAVIEYTGHDTFFHGTVTISGQYNTNYTAGLKWHCISGQTPAGSVVFENLKIQETLIGILYGQLDGTTVIDGQQSENHIKNIQMKDVQQALYLNQSNGVLNIHGGTVTVSPGSWAGNFTEADARIVEKYQGALVTYGVQYNMTNTTTGYGFENKAGSLNIVGGNWEIVSINFLLSGGNIAVSDIASAIWSRPLLPFCELVDATSGNFTLSNFRWAKTSGLEGSDQALIETNSVTDWDVNLTDVLCENQNRNSLIKSAYKNNTWLTNISMSNVRTRSTAGDLDISTSPYNLLDSVPTSTTAVDNLWFNQGTVTTTTNAEVPTVAGRVYGYSIKVDASATAETIMNIDQTSTTTIRATGMRVTSGKKYIVEGWIKRETGGSGVVKLRTITYNNAGGGGVADDISDQTQFVAQTWTYITGIVTVPTSGAFMGVGIRVENDIGYFIDLKVSRVD